MTDELKKAQERLKSFRRDKALTSEQLKKRISMEPEERAREMARKLGFQGGAVKEDTEFLAEALRRQTIESRNEALEEAAKVAEEGPWLSPCFEDEKIAEQWEASEQAFGNQIAELIRTLKSDLETKGE